MKKAVECPQFGNIDYGEWGSLNLIQRKDIKRLLDEMDRADEYIKTLYFKNENLQFKIDKINQYLEEHFIFDDKNGEYYQTHTFDKDNAKELRDILKEDK